MHAPSLLDPVFESCVRQSFGRQRLMGALGASIARVAPGEVEFAYLSARIPPSSRAFATQGS